MPHQRHNKGNRHNAIRADANNNINVHHENNNEQAGRHMQRMQKCCIPTGCVVKEELIDSENVGDAVRVVCNNEACDVGNWMHKSCFDEWEDSVLAYLRSCGRARSWSEKQRHQNLWTKKGYDLAYKACDCKCSRGHLRKDLDYIPPVDNAPRKKAPKKKTTSKPELNNGTTVPRERRPSGNGNTNLNHTAVGSPTHQSIVGLNGGGTVDNHRSEHGHNANKNAAFVIRKTTPSINIVNKNHEDRIRANSISSTGSSPPHSASSVTSGSDSPVPLPQSQSPPTGVVRTAGKSKFEFSESPSTAAVHMFRKRHDFSAFNVLPKHKQNPYHIKMDDDAVGNDEVRTFVLNHLSSYKMTSLNCVLCKNELCIFDRYPLVDGTLFLSPQAYDNQALRVISEGRLQFINAVCVACLEGGNDVRCASCKRKWDGSALLLGSMYSYDIFAAMPCCQKRLTCKHCRRAVVDITSGLPYYSEYSHMISCPYCKAYDYHFIRPLNETFSMKISIWN